MKFGEVSVSAKKRWSEGIDSPPTLAGNVISQAELRRVARFILVGAINTCFGYLSYAALVLAGFPLWLCVLASTVAAILFNFYSYGALVFGSTALRILPRFLVLYVFIGAMNFALLVALGWIGLGPLLAQALLLVGLAGAGYFGMRLFVFGGSVRIAR